MTADERRELAPAEALGRLSAEELAALEDAAAEDPPSSELEADRETVVALEAQLPRSAPSGDLLERIMAEVEGLQAPAYSGVTGEAKLYDSDREGGTLVVSLGSTPPPPGHHDGDPDHSGVSLAGGRFTS